MYRRFALGGLVTAAALFGCNDKSDDKAPAAAEPVGKTAAPVEAPPAAAPAIEAKVLTLHLHPTIGSLCQVLAPKAFFPYDSAKLSWGDEAMIDNVVGCLNRDDLAGETLRVVGRASVKGAAPYNKALGMERAQAVADALVKQGLGRERLTVVSRGEKGFDAPETEVGRALQRRVDLQLVDPRPQTVEFAYWDVDADKRMSTHEFYTHVVDMLTIDGFDADGSGGLDEKETGDFLLGTWDEDGDGAIEKDEWGFGAKGWFPEEDRFGTFETWDSNNDGRIEKAEWGLAFGKSEIYETWDVDGDKAIYDHELSASIFKIFDLDGDGWLDMPESKNIRAWRPASAKGDTPPAP